MTDDLRKTPLHALHLELGAKMVPFAGWEMPLHFGPGILQEHHAVRTAAGMFDVSHMGEVDFHGPGALDAIQALVTNDAGKLADGRALYTVTCRPSGGIVDDCIVYRLGPEHFRIVVNAANIAKDVEHFREHAGSRCELVDRSDALALIAVQGPHAVGHLATLTADEALRHVPSFGLHSTTVQGVSIVAARTGYTGEDGFELFVAADDAPAVWRALHAAGVTPIGLGARDTLRLEARLSLYGQDIDETTNPYEAGLGWVVKLDKGPGVPPFVGHEALSAVKAAGVTRQLVGFTVEGRGIVRPGAEVLDDADAVVGQVTSGGPAPTVGGAIGLAYVPRALAGKDRPLRLGQRGKILNARQHSGPFYKRPR
ncbi:MAG: glycine cleavage system aminomethyltransferase GcvT [Myxococcales bacterium]|nr:glycine cleavage system aminomethyltransferase GcvT [Myxococcales bacterium]